MNTLRIPPHSVESEQSVLGGLMLAPQTYDVIAERLGEDDFYRREHRLIFRAIRELAAAGKPFDAVTLGDWFADRGESGSFGGPAYLAELANNTPGAANIGAYADIVRDKSLRRKLIEAGTQLAGDAFAAEGDTAALLADAIGSLMAMQKVENRAEYTLRQAMTIAYHEAVKARELGRSIPGLTSGLDKLDHILGGWHDSDLVVIGARPAMGKTALLLKFAMACAVPCGIISAEQPASQVGARIMAATSRVNASKLRNGDFDEEDLSRLGGAIERLIKRECLIYDRSNPTIADVTRIARKWKQKSGIKALFVDYVQRIDASNADRKTPKHERVGEVVRGLKTLARELEIPVVALCQVGRQVEARNDKRPSMGDMSDSSEIEKEADQVLTLYREEVYFDAGGMNERGLPTRTGIAEIAVEKNRHGPTGYVECAWLAETMRFENLEVSCAA